MRCKAVSIGKRLKHDRMKKFTIKINVFEKTVLDVLKFKKYRSGSTVYYFLERFPFQIAEGQKFIYVNWFKNKHKRKRASFTYCQKRSMLPWAEK